MKLTTLCYLEQDDQYLMLHRTKKENDANHDKWLGIGGGIEEGVLLLLGGVGEGLGGIHQHRLQIVVQLLAQGGVVVLFLEIAHHAHNDGDDAHDAQEGHQKAHGGGIGILAPTLAPLVITAGDGTLLGGGRLGGNFYFKVVVFLDRLTHTKYLL